MAKDSGTHTTTARIAHAIGLGLGRRSWAAVLASAGLLLLLATLSVAIVLSHSQARSQINSSFGLRGTNSAGFVSTYLAQQAQREHEAAGEFLALPHIDTTDLKLVTAALGAGSAVLLDSSGRVLNTYPSRPSLHSRTIAPAYADLATALRGRTGVSDLVYSPVTDSPVTTISVSYATPAGRRVFSADYPASRLALDALVDHTISYPQHEVLLVDSAEHLVAASPRTQAVTLAQADPALASASARAARGSVAGASTASTFTATPVPGTSWRLLVAVPDKRLYASITGWARNVPWLVFALVTVLGVLLVALFTRSLADRERLTRLSARMARTAQTDSLTGLYNRRALTEHLTRAAARARRHDEPLSVLMIDLDRFKQTNDTFGHEAGDRVLCTVADCMRDVLRAEDVYGRWGGDEFLIALPMTGAEGAAATAARLRDAVGGVALGEIGLPDGVPLSIGVAIGVHTSPIELIRAADLELYRAKANSRSGGVLTPR